MAANSGNNSPEILNSWKEIACYLGRGVRTVQRWERELALPVRRPGGQGRSVVIAMRSEIDIWLRSCPLETREAHTVAEFPAPAPAPVRSNQGLLLAARRLRHDVQQNRMKLRYAMTELVANLGRIMDVAHPAPAPALALEYVSEVQDKPPQPDPFRF